MASFSIFVLSITALLLCASKTALAQLPDLPRQTSTSDESFDPRGWTPRPTDNPSLHPQNIFKRQNFPNFPDFPNDAGQVVVAPDNTCGYLNGLQGAPFSCGLRFKCICFSATADEYAPIACCTTGMSCKIRTACVASTDFFGSQSNSACDEGCKMDMYTLKCTDSSRPYCGGIRFTSPNVQDFWCVSTSPTSSWRPASTTFTGQAQRVYTTIDKEDLWPNSTTDSSSTQSSETLSSGTSSSQTTSSETNTPTSDDLNEVPSATPSNSPGASAGAIAGGVVGGIAALAIMGVGAFILWRRAKQRSQHDSVADAVVESFPPHDPYVGYTGPSEMTAAHTKDTPELDHQQYQFPQEMHTDPSIVGGGMQKVGEYTQVPMEERSQLSGVGIYPDGGPQQQQGPSELDAGVYSMPAQSDAKR